MLNDMAAKMRDDADNILKDLEDAKARLLIETTVWADVIRFNPFLAPVFLGRTEEQRTALAKMEQTAPAEAEALRKKARSVRRFARRDAARVIEGRAEIEGIAVPEDHKEYSRARIFEAKGYSFIFDFFLLSLGTSVFALISFYMVGAAFRSFRVKSAEALLLVISAVIVLLGQIPIGNLLLPHSLIPRAGQKLLLIVNAAAYRGVVLGMMIGGLSMSIRLWLGLERGMFHGTD